MIFDCRMLNIQTSQSINQFRMALRKLTSSLTQMFATVERLPSCLENRKDLLMLDDHWPEGVDLMKWWSNPYICGRDELFQFSLYQKKIFPIANCPLRLIIRACNVKRRKIRILCIWFFCPLVLPMPGNTLIAVQRKLIAQFRAVVAWILAPTDLQVYR